jgi:type II secretory pathway pseudopilin PulG
MSQAIIRKTAHTLELLVVAVIVSVLAAVAIPKFTNATLRGKESSLKRELKTLRDCIELFKNDVGGYPLTLADLSATVAPSKYYKSTASRTATVASGSWKGPYITDIDRDPISNMAFKYTPTTGVVQSSAIEPSVATDGTNYHNW